VNKQVAINLNSPSEVRKAGLNVLSRELGPAGMTIFMRQFEGGFGDFTSEKYDREDIPLGDIVRLLKPAK
jgi:hypothetical protein